MEAAEVEEVFIAGARASSLVRLPLGAAFALLVAHAQRHLAQARRVLAEPAFPAQR